MTNEQIQLDKLRILRNAVNKIRKEGDEPDFIQELKDAAWTVLQENPGINRDDWIDKIIKQYPAEVIDAYGSNSNKAYRLLTDLWLMDYADPNTGKWNTFAEWSELL